MKTFTRRRGSGSSTSANIIVSGNSLPLSLTFDNAVPATGCPEALQCRGTGAGAGASVEHEPYALIIRSPGAADSPQSVQVASARAIGGDRPPSPKRGRDPSIHAISYQQEPQNKNASSVWLESDGLLRPSSRPKLVAPLLHQHSAESVANVMQPLYMHEAAANVTAGTKTVASHAAAILLQHQQCITAEAPGTTAPAVLPDIDMSDAAPVPAAPTPPTQVHDTSQLVQQVSGSDSQPQPQRNAFADAQLPSSTLGVLNTAQLPLLQGSVNIQPQQAPTLPLNAAGCGTGISALQGAASEPSSSFNLLARRQLTQNFIARVMSEFAPAQTVVEAQERGEVVQLQDDAVYALDGLTAGSSLATQRDSALALASILITRRGRAALRADAFAQQVLTAAAKLRGHRDSVLATAFSAILLSLSQEDAHPSYLASQAAALLVDQLLQVQHVYDADLVVTASTPRAAAMKGGCGGISSATACTSGTSSSARGGGKVDGKGPKARAPESPILRALRLVCEGPLARQVSTIPMLRSHVSLVLLALAQATSTHASKVHFSDRVKHNLRKLGVLEKLGRVVAVRHAHLAEQLPSCCPAAEARADVADDSQDSACMMAGAEPCPMSLGSEPQCFPMSLGCEPQAASEVLAASASAPAITCRSLAAELHLALVVLENATFTCTENEVRLLNMRLDRKVPALSDASQSQPEDLPAASAAALHAVQKQSFVGLLVDVVRLLSWHMLELSPHVYECVHVAVAVLMNITHQHAEGVAQVAAADGLAVMAALVHHSCQPAATNPALWALSAAQDSLTSQPAHERGASQRCGSQRQLGGSHSRLAGLPPSVACRAAILGRLEVMSVCMGLLINMVATHPGHSTTLARLGSTAGAEQWLGWPSAGPLRQSMDLGAPPAEGWAHSSDNLAAGSVGAMVPLLCSIIDAMQGSTASGTSAADKRDGGAPGLGSDCMDTEDPCLSAAAMATGASDCGGGEAGACGSGGGAEITEDTLLEDQQEGEASIVQVYAAMLLGFIIQGSPELRSVALSHLHSGSLHLVVAAVQRCLQFYITAGAITDVSRETLTNLLVTLQAQERQHATAQA